MDSIQSSTFKRRPGTAGMHGQQFEIYMALFFLLESFDKYDKNQFKNFRIASNMEDAGLFDDIVFNYSETASTWDERKTLFIQLKHKEKPTNAKERITINKLLLENRNAFTIKDYFRSYRSIKKQFSVENSSHPIFGGKFENCDFIIFTNAEAHKEFNETNDNLSKFNIDKEYILKFDKTKYYYKILTNGDRKQEIIDILQYASECTLLAKQLTDCIFPNDKYKTREILNKDLIKQYEYPLMTSVIKKNDQGLGQFNPNFINGDNLSVVERNFRDTFYEEIKKNEEFYNKSITDIIPEIKSLEFKLPAKFGETDSNSISSLPNDLVEEVEILEFLNQLKLYISQPSLNELKNEILTRKIKDNYSIDEYEAQNMISLIKQNVENWWSTEDKYLCEKDKRDYFDLMKISIQFEIEAPVANFTGRDTELDNLHRCFKEISIQDQNIAVISQMASVSGLGGIGKTQLARQYMRKYAKFYNYNLIWLNAETQNNITESFKRLCRDKLKINTEDTNKEEKHIKSIVQEVYQFFSKRKSIFVFDNAERNDIKIFLELQADILIPNKPYILITSRDKEWYDGINVIEIKELEIEDAIKLVKTELEISDDSEDESINTLVIKLQCYPLALQQAISFIKHENKVSDYNISDYLNEFQTKSKDLLESNKSLDLKNTYTQTTYTTWNITKEKIKRDQDDGELALEILNIISYFAPENINRDIFKHLVKLDEGQIDEGKLRNAIRLLVRLSMVNGEKKQSIISVHRLVQKVTRLELKMEKNDEHILRRSLETVKYGIDQIYTNSDHTISTWKYAKKYVNLLKEFKDLPSKIIEKLIDSLRYKEAVEFGESNLQLLIDLIGLDDQSVLSTKQNLASAYLKQGKYTDALNIYNEVYEKRKKLLGESHLDTLTTKHKMAQVYDKQGKYTDALNIYNEVYEKRKELLGESHLYTLGTKHNIASVYDKQGKYTDALNIYNEVHEKGIELLGVSYLDTFPTKHNIAVVYQKQGKYTDALNIYNEVYEKRKVLLGESHLDTLTTKHNMAQVYDEQGKYTDALNIYNEVYEKQKELLGESHLETLRTKHNKASVYQKQGKYTDALNIYDEVYEKRKELLGETHLDTLTTKHNIAYLYERQGKYTEALNIYNEVYEKQKEILGESHLATLITKHNIAIVYEKQGKYTEALNIYNEVYEKRKELLGESHLDTLTTKHNIAYLYERQGKYTDALNIYNEVYEKKKEILGESHLNTLTTKHNIANVYEKQGKYTEALNIYNEVYEKQKEILGESHLDNLTTKHNIAYLYERQGKYTDALNIYNEVYEKRKELLGESHLDTLTTKHNIAYIYNEQGKYTDALNIYNEVYEKQKEILGESHLDTLTTKHCIASVYHKQGKDTDALNIFNEVYEKIKEILGESHPDTLTTKHNIAYIYDRQGKYTDALNIYNEVYEKQKDTLGETHLVTIRSKHNIASVYNKQGKYTNALNIWNEVHEKLKELLGESHLDTLTLKINIAQVYDKQGKYTEALNIYNEVYEKVKKY